MLCLGADVPNEHVDVTGCEEICARRCDQHDMKAVVECPDRAGIGVYYVAQEGSTGAVDVLVRLPQTVIACQMKFSNASVDSAVRNLSPAVVEQAVKAMSERCKVADENTKRLFVIMSTKFLRRLHKAPEDCVYLTDVRLRPFFGPIFSEIIAGARTCFAVGPF